MSSRNELTAACTAPTFAVLALVLMSHCGGDSEAVVLRQDAVLIYAGMKANRADCTSGDDAYCSTYEAVFVQDVDSDYYDGVSRIAVLTTRGGFDENPLLHLSEDLGATWRTVFLTNNLISDYGWDLLQIGVHLAHGEVSLMFTQTRVGAGGLDYHEAKLFRVDLQTGALSEVAAGNGMLAAVYPQHRDDGHLRSMQQDFDFRDLLFQLLAGLHRLRPDNRHQ